MMMVCVYTQQWFSYVKCALSTGLAIIGFEQTSMTVIEGTHDSVLVYVQITIPIDKMLGCNVEVSFTVSDGTLARKEYPPHTLLCFCFTNTDTRYNNYIHCALSLKMERWHYSIESCKF